MKKIFTLLAAICIAQFASAQCLPSGTYTSSAWTTDTASTSAIFNGVLCDSITTMYTRVGWDYYDGDGYFFNALVGSQLQVYTYDCTGNPVGLTIVDSTQNNIINGAHAAAACFNTLTFTAPYTGKYYVVFSLNDSCGVSGSDAIGKAAIHLLNGSSIACPAAPPTPTAPENDLICDAINMSLNTNYYGDNTNAALTDPRDAAVDSAGYTCSTPNNTLWYKFTAPTTGTYLLTTTSPSTGGLETWVGIFEADSCSGMFTSGNCLTGSDPGLSYVDSLQLQANTTIYIMIDGLSGSTGAFAISIAEMATSLANNKAIVNKAIYPNPSSGLVNISTTQSNSLLEVYNTIGERVYTNKLQNSGVNTLDLSTLNNGIYIVKITNNNIAETRSIVIAK